LCSTLTHFDEQHRLSYKDTDFAISLHFESPKINDIYTYFALWNPIEIFFDWGYEKTVEKILTHDDLLSCASDFADAHALNLFEAVGRCPPTPLPRLNHTISGKVLPPALSEKSRAPGRGDKPGQADHPLGPRKPARRQREGRRRAANLPPALHAGIRAGRPVRPP
jgi:hypothetical protein